MSFLIIFFLAGATPSVFSKNPDYFLDSEKGIIIYSEADVHLYDGHIFVPVNLYLPLFLNERYSFCESTLYLEKKLKETNYNLIKMIKSTPEYSHKLNPSKFFRMSSFFNSDQRSYPSKLIWTQDLIPWSGKDKENYERQVENLKKDFSEGIQRIQHPLIDALSSNLGCTLDATTTALIESSLLNVSNSFQEIINATLFGILSKEFVPDFVRSTPSFNIEKTIFKNDLNALLRMGKVELISIDTSPIQLKAIWTIPNIYSEKFGNAFTQKSCLQHASIRAILCEKSTNHFGIPCLNKYNWYSSDNCYHFNNTVLCDLHKLLPKNESCLPVDDKILGTILSACSMSINSSDNFEQVIETPYGLSVCKTKEKVEIIHRYLVRPHTIFKTPYFASANYGDMLRVNYTDFKIPSTGKYIYSIDLYFTESQKNFKISPLEISTFSPFLICFTFSAILITIISMFFYYYKNRQRILTAFTTSN